MPTYRDVIGEMALLTDGRAHVNGRAEHTVVGSVWPGDREVRYLISSTRCPSERIAREHENTAS